MATCTGASRAKGSMSASTDLRHKGEQRQHRILITGALLQSAEQWYALSISSREWAHTLSDSRKVNDEATGASSVDRPLTPTARRAGLPMRMSLML